MRRVTNTTKMSERSRRASSWTDYSSCRATRAWTKNSSAPSARVSRPRIKREYRYAASSIVLGSDAWLRKMPRGAPRHDSSRPDYSQSAQVRMLESGAERSALGAPLRSGRHGISPRWLEFSGSKYVNAESHEQTNK